jgi:hypothetical protein
MGTRTPEDDGIDLGGAVIEDLARAVFRAHSNTSRQPDPADTPSPEDGETDTLGAGVASVATPAPLPPIIDLGVEPATRRVTDFLLFATLVVLLLAVAVAYADPGPVTIGLALLLAGVLIATWRVRGRHRTAAVVATGGRLEIVSNGGRHVFDLARRDHPVEAIGLPGDRRWRVLFHRRGMRPYVVDASMVDPGAFIRLLHGHRCEVHYRPR